LGGGYYWISETRKEMRSVQNSKGQRRPELAVNALIFPALVKFFFGDKAITIGIVLFETWMGKQ